MASIAAKNAAVSTVRKSALKESLINVRRRRAYLINPEVQFKITRHFMLIIAAACGLSIGNYHVAQTLMNSGGMDEVGVILSVGYSAMMLLISGSLLFLLCVFLSHRIAGPVAKVSKALDGMAQGDFSVKIRLRDSDLLKELANSVNATNRTLGATLSELDREVRRARTLAGGNAELERCLARAEAKLASFRLSTGVELDPRASMSATRRR